LQKKAVVSEIGVPLSSSKDVFATDLAAMRIKDPIFVELKSALQQHIV
jgi:hypothetical protein